jgi:hypothetical protein
VGVAEVTEGPEASQAALASPEAADSLGAATLRYGQVDITAGPSDLDGWSPLGLSDRSEVFGQGFKCDAQGICAVPLLKRKADGRFEKVASNFLGNDVNKYGDVGGCVVKDPVSLAGQAAILRASGKVELIPPLRGETASCITKLSDGCVAVVTSVDASSTVTVYVLEGRRITPITVAGGSVEDVNDRGQIAGVISSNPDANRAYRFDSHTGKTTILTPVSTDPHSWAMGINSKGEVLGYSFAFDAIERVGKWNRNDVFETSFVEGTPEFPTVSNRLVWNESGLIIISYSLNDPNTYLVPKPGVRLALSGLVVNGPVAETLFVLQVNARADFVATSVADGRSFLFVRK